MHPPKIPPGRQWKNFFSQHVAMSLTLPASSELHNVQPRLERAPGLVVRFRGPLPIPHSGRNAKVRQVPEENVCLLLTRRVILPVEWRALRSHVLHGIAKLVGFGCQFTLYVLGLLLPC